MISFVSVRVKNILMVMSLFLIWGLKTGILLILVKFTSIFLAKIKY